MACRKRRLPDRRALAPSTEPREAGTAQPGLPATSPLPGARWRKVRPGQRQGKMVPAATGLDKEAQDAKQTKVIPQRNGAPVNKQHASVSQALAERIIAVD